MSPLLKLALDAVMQAGKIVMGEYESPDGGQYLIKEDGSPLTRADSASSDYLVQTLEKGSSIPVVSEERLGTLPSGDFWLVDPVDGTKEFLARTGEFTINVALIREGKPYLGVIFAPALAECYFAEAGQGAYQVLHGQQIALPVVPAKDWILARSRFHDEPRVEQFARQNNIEKNVIVGAALKFGRLAAGQVTVYARYQNSMEWDTAAGQILLQEAKGSMIDLHTGYPPVYGKPGFRNHFFLACGFGLQLGKLKLVLHSNGIPVGKD